MRRKYGGEELFGIIGAAIDSVLGKHGISPQVASTVALEVSAKVRDGLGASTIYIPKGRPDADETAAEVYARWKNGEHVLDIAQQLSFTSVYIYRLLAKERTRLQSIREDQLKNRMKIK